MKDLHIGKEDTVSAVSSKSSVNQKQDVKKPANRKSSKQESKTQVTTRQKKQTYKIRQKQEGFTQAMTTDSNTTEEVEPSSASFPDKETVDCSKHQQRELTEKIVDGDAMGETDESHRVLNKQSVPFQPIKNRNRKRKRQKETEQGRTDEKTCTGREEVDATINKKSITSPKGLLNLGNTCFFNAAMQNLNQSFVLRDLLKAEPRSELPLTKSVVEFYEQMGKNTNKPLNPIHVFNSLCKRSPRFSGGHQQDSHELLRHLLNGIRNEEREVSPEQEKRKILTKVDKVFGGHFMTVYTCTDCNQPYHVCEPFLDISLPIVQQEYNDDKEYEIDEEGDTARRQATVDELSFKKVAAILMTPLNRCSHRSQHTREPSANKKRSNSSNSDSKRKKNDDSCAATSRPRKKSRTESRSILDCFSAFTRKEFITKEYLCTTCHERRVSNGETDYQMSSATKRTLIYNPPALLTIHLKRFTQTPRGFVKCNDMITFPDQLDLSPYCSSQCMRNDGNEPNIWYSLYGVVVHGGDLSGGHYSAYVKLRTPDDNIKHFLQKSFLDRDTLTEGKLVEMMKEALAHPNQTPRMEWTPNEPVKETWFCVSDCNWSPVPKSVVLQRSAYLLFYERMTRMDDDAH